MSAEADPANPPDAAEPTPSGVASSPALFERLESYDWSSDAEFQSGLAAILGPTASSQSSQQNAELTLRARCFYFTRKFDTPVEFAAYSAWRSARPDSDLSPLEPANPPPPIVSSDPVTPEKSNTRASSNNVTPQKDGVEVLGLAGQQEVTRNGDTHPASFTEVMELIKSGKPIPGIKQIPATILEGQGTLPAKSQRRKPWEREQPS